MQTTIKSTKKQRIAAELESIIDDMAKAMRDADKSYVARYRAPTLNMSEAWEAYLAFCTRNPGA